MSNAQHFLHFPDCTMVYIHVHIQYNVQCNSMQSVRQKHSSALFLTVKIGECQCCNAHKLCSSTWLLIVETSDVEDCAMQ